MESAMKIRCDQCGHRIGVEAILPNEAWEAIASGAYALCIPCIDDRLADRGITASAALAFRGRALQIAAPDELEEATRSWRPSKMQVERDAAVGLPALAGWAP